ncbi:MAG: ABC transporter permease [Nesterenkonia sp.]|uniref:ABC transporter permease n=1 Tax=Nesterenkonia marinintestina TaxID=2979865 RepID=UPI0021BF25C7|nr:ABC transporter permease [Nesterenkonia sp. GX14115]MDO5493903.1 ABC transporter permease [Nesterenkonia sp.]
MFLALRDIRFATGRFALMGGVVTLITFLLVMLSGLTSGLAQQTTGAIDDLDADTVAFGSPAGQDEPEEDFTDSTVTAAQLRAWQDADHVDSAAALGISQTRMSLTGDREGVTSVALFGADGSPAPEGAQPEVGEAVLTEGVTEELEVGAGDRIEVGGEELEVVDVVDEQSYSHVPVVWTTLDDWRTASHVGGSGGGDDEVVGTVVVSSFAEDVSSENLVSDLAPGLWTGLTGAETTPEQVRDDVDAAAGTSALSRTDSFHALPSYTSENGSLTMIQGFLYGISALVIVAFLSVWTVQRTRDIAVLRALGASSTYVLRDAVGQALIILVAGAALGGALGAAGGMFAAQAAPFLTDATTTLLPMAGVVVIGAAGSILAVRRVTTVDPMIALGGN